MSNIHEKVHADISRYPSRYPRDLRELSLSIALLIPWDHELAHSIDNCLDSMGFSPPENHPLYFNRFLEDLNSEFPEDSMLTAPWWVNVIAMLILGGAETSIELRDRLDRDFRQEQS